MPDDTQPARYTISFMLHNRRQTARRLILEPWGDEYEMAPGAAIQIVAEGPVGEALELVDSDDSVTIWGWSGSVVALFQDGKQVDVPGRLPVPGVPQGMSVRSFLDVILRGPDNEQPDH